MTCLQRLVLWALCAGVLGFCVGYFSSSQFCTASIERRAQKEVALNQLLRELFAKRTFLMVGSLYMSSFNESQVAEFDNAIREINKKIVHILATYYDNKSAAHISQLLEQQLGVIKEQEPDMQTHLVNNNALFITFLTQLNPQWASAKETIESILKEQAEALIQEKTALQSKDIKQALIVSETYFEKTMQLADELDRGITKQFPHKF